MVRRGFGNRSDAEVQRMMGKKCDKFFFFVCVYTVSGEDDRCISLI